MRRYWLIYAVVYSFFLSTLAMAEVRKLTQEDMEWAGTPHEGSTTVTSAGGHVGHPLPVSPNIDVRVYGTALTDNSVTAAIAAASDGDVIVMPRATYTFASQVTVNKSVTILLNGTKIVGPATNYAFNVTVNDASIIGYGDAKITLTQGCSGGIHNNQAMRTRYRDLKIDMNDVTNAIGFFHDGGWYVSMENVEIEKAQTAASSDGIKIQGTYTGVAGDTGSYGGAYVSIYKNVVARTVRMIASVVGGNVNKVTTMTFENLDAETVYATNAVALTFLQPVMQITSGGTFWSLDNVAGFTAMGGDFEGNGTTVYTTTGTVRGISSIGNQISTGGAANTYISGDITATGYFFDDYTPADLTGEFHGHVVSSQELTFRNTGYTEKVHYGLPYTGDMFTLSLNGKKLSDNTANLDDTTVAATYINMNTSGQIILQYSIAGSNPVAVDNIATFDNGGANINVAYTYENNADAIAGGLTAGRLYRTSTGVLMIVYTP